MFRSESGHKRDPTSGLVWGRGQVTECNGHSEEGVETGGREENSPKYEAQKQRQKRNEWTFERAVMDWLLSSLKFPC